MVKKRSLVFLIIGVIFGCLLATGIFAVVTKSVSFNLALKVEPKIFFSMTLQVSNDNGGTWSAEKEIFNNKSGANVVNWATVNQNTIVLNQVLAGENLPEIANGSKLKLTVMNLTEKSADNAEEYLHLTLNYHSEDVKTFTMDNGYGIVNMEYDEETATQSMIITATNILADTYILIPFLAEIDEYRYTATITTENCEVVSAPRTFTANTPFEAQFWCDNFRDPIYTYDITIAGNAYTAGTTDKILQIPKESVTGDLVINCFVNKPVRDYTNPVWDGGLAASFAAGTGTADDPFLIYNPRQMALLAYLTNNYNSAQKCVTTVMQNDITTNISQTCDASVTFASANYKLMNNLILNNKKLIDENKDPITANTATCIQWTAIGTADNPFKGCFDGDYRVISGLYVNKPESYNQSLFGLGERHPKYEHVYNSISRVGVVNSVIIGLSQVGGIGGVEHSISYSFSDCYVEAVGVNNNGNASVGGIAGTNCYISSCYSLSKVVGTKQTIGGIIGNAYSAANADINNCYFIGTISTSATHQVGAICGTIGLDQVIQNSYYLSTSCAYAGGGISKTESEMKSYDFVKLLNSTNNYPVWLLADRQNLNSNYPIIIGFYSALYWYNYSLMAGYTA